MADLGTIYFVQAEEGGPVKIGFTVNAERRMSALQVGAPKPMKLLGSCAGTIEDEERLHRHFAETRVRGEWFAPTEALLSAILSGNPLSVIPPVRTESPTSTSISDKKFEMSMPRDMWERARKHARAEGMQLVPWIRWLVAQRIAPRETVEQAIAAIEDAGPAGE